MTPATVVTVERLTQFHNTDLDDLCHATSEAINAGGGFGWIKPPRRHLLEAFWKGAVLVPERQVLVARLDGVIAASAQMVRPTRNNEAQSHQAQLTTTFVAPWARGRGLARMVVKAAEEAAVGTGAAVMNMDLRETQIAAIRLIESLGYTRWGIHPAYATVGGSIVRGFFYFKALGPEGQA